MPPSTSQKIAKAAQAAPLLTTIGPAGRRWPARIAAGITSASNPGSAISSISGTTTYFFPRGLRHREIGRRLELEIHVHVVLGGPLEHFLALAAHQPHLTRAHPRPAPAPLARP